MNYLSPTRAKYFTEAEEPLDAGAVRKLVDQLQNPL